MKLYSATAAQFISDIAKGKLPEKLTEACATYLLCDPSPEEVQAWKNSLPTISHVIDKAGLADVGVVLEYPLPHSSRRLDCLLTGRDRAGSDRAVIIELKQWSRCEACVGTNEVTTWVGGAKREVLHPSVQVGQYKMYLQELVPAFYQKTPIQLEAIAYLHNYIPTQHDELYAEKFRQNILDCPLFCAPDIDLLIAFLKQRLSAGNGMAVLERVEHTPPKASKKLMDHVRTMLDGRDEYVLLDEQLVVYDRVLSTVDAGLAASKKSVYIVRGGPGSGKSVIAINLLAELLGRGVRTHYATGSKACTETLKNKVGVNGEMLFQYFSSYVNSSESPVAVLICDEAHRIRETSSSWYGKNKRKSTTPQIDELIRVAKLVIFFVDDRQNIRPDEVGSADYIRKAAQKMDCELYEYELESQFRCAGLQGYVDWIDTTLAISESRNSCWRDMKAFEFQIVNSPQELRNKIELRNSEKGNSARLVAGYCWQWSLKPNSDGTLVNDVRIGDFAMPWEARDRSNVASNIPPASLWAHDPGGINQIGTVYTAQGFDFDYVGVIFGPDLVYRFNQQGWVAVAGASADEAVKKRKDKLLGLLKNVYRVLLTRGMKGCYVYFVDKETENFFKSRIEIKAVKAA